MAGQLTITCMQGLASVYMPYTVSSARCPASSMPDRFVDDGEGDYHVLCRAYTCAWVQGLPFIHNLVHQYFYTSVLTDKRHGTNAACMYIDRSSPAGALVRAGGRRSVGS
jgi:hypothetical protein